MSLFYGNIFSFYKCHHIKEAQTLWVVFFTFQISTENQKTLRTHILVYFKTNYPKDHILHSQDLQQSNLSPRLVVYP